MPVRHFPFDGDPYRPQMGLRPLDLHDWIEPDDALARDLGLKEQILRHHRDTVLRVMPEAEAACLELHRTLKGHLHAHAPDLYDVQENTATVRGTGRTFTAPASGADALAQIAQLVQEDFCLMSPAPPVRLEAGCVCFPSRWSLADKMNQASDGIHAPVPKFAETIAVSTNAFLEKIQVHRPMWRLNWTLHDSDELFAPHPSPPGPDLDEASVLAATFLRVERQTLRRLPQTGYVAFSIRTHLTPLTEVAADPERRRLLGDVIRSLPEEVAFYKGMRRFWGALKRAL